MIYLTCGRCGSFIGQAKDADAAREVNREHIAQCEIYS